MQNVIETERALVEEEEKEEVDEEKEGDDVFDYVKEDNMKKNKNRKSTFIKNSNLPIDVDENEILEAKEAVDGIRDKKGLSM